MFWVKLKAGALQLTLFIMVVIAILIFALILFVHTHKQFQIQSGFLIEATQNTNLGINYALKNKILLSDTTSISINSNGDYRSLNVHRNFWGIYEKVVSTSKIKQNQFQKIALISNKQGDKNRVALYLSDNNSPLVVVGNTKIKGVTYLPKRSVKTGTISGQSYYGTQLIYGAKRISNKLPELDSETLLALRNSNHLYKQFEPNQFLNIYNKRLFSNSFLNPSQIIFSNDLLNLENIQVTGHIIIQSKSKIVVHPSSKLKDVILIAPEIEVKATVEGNFQAIASKAISVGENTRLHYPSSLVMIEDNQNTLSATTANLNLLPTPILIKDNATIKGSVIYLGLELASKKYKTQIQLNKNAVIYGDLYCNQNTELKGSVYGTIYTNNFVTNLFGSIYQNHLYNAVIDVEELSKEYVGLPLSNNNSKGIAKWLY